MRSMEKPVEGEDRPSRGVGIASKRACKEGRRKTRGYCLMIKLGGFLRVFKGTWQLARSRRQLGWPEKEWWDGNKK